MNFNWKTYVENYEDLRKAGINNERKAKTHWQQYGQNEGRTYLKIINTQENDKNSNKNKLFKIWDENDSIIDCTFKNYEFKIIKKSLIIISCHSNSIYKYNILKNNIKFFEINNIDIIIVNSKEYKNMYDFNFSGFIKNVFYVENDKYYDFGKWYHVINNIDYNEYTNIIFINDSIILTNNINNYFLNIDNNNYDLYGFNNSLEITEHYQSYIFSIKNTAIPKFVEMFEKHKNQIVNFNDIIRYYEFGLFETFLNKSCYLNLKNLSNGKNIFFLGR
jgi:hypothetical protein